MRATLGGSLCPGAGRQADGAAHPASPALALLFV